MNPALRTLVAACSLAAVAQIGSSQPDYGPAAAAVPRGNLPGPTIMVVQKQLSPLTTRFTTWDEAAQAWSPWAAGPASPGFHFDTEIPAIACHVRSNGSNPRFDVFFSTLDRSRLARPFPIVATAQRFKPAEGDPPAAETLPIRDNPTGSLFFPAAARGWNTMQTVSIMGTSMHFSPTNGRPLFRVRELFNNGSNEVSRDVTNASHPGAELVEFSSHAIATWESDGSPVFSRTAVWHERLANLPTGNIVLAHLKGDRNGPNGIIGDADTIVPLGSPAARITGAPLLTTQAGFAPAAQNVFVVAEDASGRRHLFERHNPTNDPADVNAWSPWKDHGFPHLPDGSPPKVDDLSVTVALVWKDDHGQLRINFFGQRWGRLVEYWWNGANWAWSASSPLPPALQGCRITSSAVAPTGTNGRPRLSIFAVDVNERIWERVWNWPAGTWDWKPMN